MSHVRMLAAGLVLSACGAEAPTAVAEIQIQNYGGNAVLKGQVGLEQAQITLQPRGIDEASIPKHFKVSRAEGEGKTQLLVERIKDAPSEGVFLDVLVVAPADAFFQEDVPDGDARVEDMQGGGQVRASKGNISLVNVGGTLSAEAQGDIRITGHPCRDKLQLLSEKGSVDVEVVEECRADFRAAAPDGVDVREVDFVGFSAPTGVLGRIKAEGAPMEMAASEGSVKVHARAP
ncbi:MAG: hypothetical protein AB2A00_21060 [Myxococcota bacterium]